MPLLLLPQSAFGLGILTGSDAALATLADVELWLSGPDGEAMARVEADTLEIKLAQAALSQYTLQVKARLGSALCTSEYAGDSALSNKWSGWVLTLHVRGLKVFDGPIEAWDIVWGGNKQPGAAFEDPSSSVTLTALDWIPALLRRRVIRTATGAAYSGTGTPKQIAAEIINNAMGSSLLTPPDWQTGSETRDDLGPWSVTASAGSGGTSTTWKAGIGENVLDVILEICNSAASDEDWLWPVANRSGVNVAISFLRGRSGASREIGTDRTSAASGMLGGGPISAERGNLVAYQQTGDRTQRANHLLVTGKGRAGSGQRKRQKASASGILADGVYEDMVNIPDGGTDAELDHEAQRLVNERADAQLQHKVRMIEIAGAVWPSDFGIGDSLPVYTPTGEELALVATGLIWTLAAPGPARLEVDLGKWPRLVERDLGRSGGGGSGGGRGGGGRPRSKSGESEVDPDDITGFPTVTGQTGGPAVADALDDSLDFAGYDVDTVVRVYTHVGDNPETVKDEIRGTYTAGALTANGYVWLRTDTGAYVKLLAESGGAP